jgi:hypothetical protein
MNYDIMINQQSLFQPKECGKGNRYPQHANYRIGWILFHVARKVNLHNFQFEKTHRVYEKLCVLYYVEELNGPNT